MPVRRQLLLGLSCLVASCAGAETPSAVPASEGTDRSLATDDDAGESSSTSAPSSTTSTAPGSEARVAHVVDGDTVDLADGRTVRLAQVDAPEGGECFGQEATEALSTLVAGAVVSLSRAPSAPATDRYGRVLAEVLVGGLSVNERLVADGAGEWYDEFAYEDAALAARLEAAETAARAASRGLWSVCVAAPTAQTPPTTTADAVVPPALSGAGCDPSYPEACIPPPPPDLDCGDIPHRRFQVLAPDPHGFDGDADGIGCES